MPKPKDLLGPWPLERWFIPATLLYLELVFKVSTTGGWFPSLIFIILFSFAAGQALWLLIALFKSRRAQERATIALLPVLGVVYSVEYFVYREFKVFYDLYTITAGAGGVATGFGDSVLSLVFSPSGIGHIIAFLAPVAVYLVLRHLRNRSPKTVSRKGPANSQDIVNKLKSRVFTPARPSLVTFGGVALQIVAIHLICLLGIALAGSWGRTYTDHYSFQDAVTSFGLFTGLRKEVQHIVTGAKEQVSFSSASTDEGPEEITSHTQSTMASIAGTSSLSIDYKRLQESADNETHAQLDAYVSSLTPSAKNEYTGLFAGKNLIFISAEAFSREVIRQDLTPTLWRMAVNGIQFIDYYQYDNCGTTGGELQNVFGLYPTEGGRSFKMTSSHNNYLTIGNALNRMGYNGWAFHNNSTYFYDRDVTHNVLGYNNGYMGMGDGMEQWVSDGWPESDLEMIQGTFSDVYGTQEPFNVYYMSVSGHSEYKWGENTMADKNREVIEATESLQGYSEPVQAYLAANYELEAAMSWLVSELEARGMADDTVIVIAADHFPYGLDNDVPPGQNMPFTSELYGYNVETYFQRDHNRLIIWSGCLEKDDPIVVKSPTSSVDILPTLLNLFGCKWDSRLLPGRDVFSDRYALVSFLTYDWKTAYGTYYASEDRFDLKNGFSEEDIPDGYVDAINDVVADKINYCRGVLTSDYWRHVFGRPEDTKAVHDAAVKTREKDLAELKFDTTARRVAVKLRLPEE